MDTKTRQAYNLRFFNRMLFSSGEKMNQAVFVIDGETSARKVKAVNSIGHIKTKNPSTKHADVLSVYFEDSKSNIYIIRYDTIEKCVTSLRSGYNTLEQDVQLKDFVGHRSDRAVK